MGGGGRDKSDNLFTKSPDDRGIMTRSSWDGYLDKDSMLQIQVFFKPDRAGQDYDRELVLTYGDSAPIE